MEQARFERDLAVASGQQFDEPGENGVPHVPASSRLHGQLAPLGRLTSPDDDRTVNP